MAVILEGIELPDDIQWIDEFSGHGVGQTVTPTLTGALVVEESEQTEGRPMTLDGGRGSWISRSKAEAIALLAATALEDGETLALEWADGTNYEVVFDRSRDNGFQATEVQRVSRVFQGAEHQYFIKLNLLIKGAV